MVFIVVFFIILKKYNYYLFFYSDKVAENSFSGINKVTLLQEYIDICSIPSLTDAVGVYVPHIVYTFVPMILPSEISILTNAAQSLVIYNNAE